MKKLLLGAIISMVSLSAMANLNGDGYYRVQNALTKRYAYLMDNKGSFDVSTTSADVHALQLYTGFLRASSDPASVFYLKNSSGSLYNVSGQGTSLYDFLGEYLKIIAGKVMDGQQAYFAYATKKGMTKYLGDLQDDYTEEKGFPSVSAKGDDRLWYIIPLSADDDCYFGIAPTHTVNGKYYHPFYSGFAYGAINDNVKFYVVTKIDHENAIVVISELDGVVPAGTPVIVECENPLASDNRLEIGPSGDAANISANFLKGVYFDNSMTTHYNRTRYDKRTMRSLAVVDGKLKFVVGDYEFLPRNEAYLKLTTSVQCDVEEYLVMTETEYADFDDVKIISADVYVDVYNVDGTLVKEHILKADIDALPHGLYILRSADSTEKHLVH